MDIRHHHGSNYDAEISLLHKYKDMFPASFINCIETGTSWLCSHNNITYQSSVTFRTDAFIYGSSGTGLLQLAVIDIDRPFSGLKYFDIISVEDSKDDITGNPTFKIKVKYTTPLGLNVVLVPIQYYVPSYNKKEYYKAQEVDALLYRLEARITSRIPNTSDFVKAEDVVTEFNNFRIQINDISNRLDKITSSKPDVPSTSPDGSGSDNSGGNSNTGNPSDTPPTDTNNGNYDELLKQISNVNNTVNDLSGTVTGLDTKVTDISSTVNGLSASVSSLQTKTDDMALNINNIDTIDGKVSTLANDIATLQSGIDTNTSAVADLSNKVNNIDNSVTDISNTLDTTKKSVLQLESRIETLEQNGTVTPPTDTNPGETEVPDVTPEDKYLVIVAAGQSNMVGYDESPITIDDVNLMDDKIKQLSIWTDNKAIIPLGVCAENFQDMRSFSNPNNYDGQQGTKGVHLPLANQLLKYLPDGYKILILPCAYGGTGFSSGNAGTYDSDTMMPSTGTLKWSSTSPYYQALRDRLKYVLGLNKDNKFGGLIWCQGEADGPKPDDNKTGFAAMMAQFTQDFVGFESQSLFGAYDKSCIFIYETIAPYWYGSYANASGVRDIWKNYRTYVDSNYVEIPWSAHTNATNGTGATSSTKTAHYGDNAYKTWVAPRLANRILSNTTNEFYVNKTAKTFTDFTFEDFYKPTDSEATLSLVGKGLFTTTNVTGSIDDVRKSAVFFRDNSELVIFCMKRGYFGIFSGDKTTMATDTNPYTCIGIYDKTRNLDKMLIQLKTTTFTTQQKAVANTLTYTSGDLVIMAKKDNKLGIYVYQVDTANLITVTGADDINALSFLSSTDKARGYRFGVLYGFSTSEASYVSDTSLVLSNAKYVDTLPSGTNVRDLTTIKTYISNYLSEF